jgi:hypothetical protein
MRSYQTGLEYYFRELGQKVPAGSVITLRQGDAERYLSSHPGLLRPMPMTTQARPQAVRSEPEAPAPVETPAEEVKADVVPEAPAEEKKEEPAAEPKAEEAPAPVEAPSAEAPQPDQGEARPKAKARAKK